MNIFEYLIAPFTFLIKHIFLLCYSITSNYGLSIIFLSFFVSVLLLPVFIFIEKAKKKDDAIKLSMKPFIDEIKRCYKGQERYYYIKTLNRQYNYNAARSLIPTLSLLLQIPFFIAAYQFLEHFEPLAGIGFLFIKDLNLPDGLWGNINVLPIAMTVVNLITAYFYTRNGNISELRQMIIVATIFLVLLFNLPAGLVLYWTMNNVFSFFRLFITNPEVFQKNENRRIRRINKQNEFKTRTLHILPKLKITFYLILIGGAVFLLNEASNNSFKNFGFSLIILIAECLAVTLTIGLLTIIHKRDVISSNSNEKTSIIKYWPNFKPLFIIFSLVAIGTQINWAILLGFHSIVQRLVGALLVSTSATIFLAFVVLFFQGHLKLSLEKYQLNPLLLERKYKLSFFLLVSVFAISLIIHALFNSWNNLVILLTGSFVLSWIAIIFTTNRKLIFTKERLKKLHETYHNIRVNPVFFFSISFLSIYFLLAGLFYFTGESQNINIIAVTVTLIGQFLGFNFFKNYRKQNHSVWSGLTLVVLISLIIIQLLLGLASAFNVDINQNAILSTTPVLLNIVIPGIIFILITHYSFYKIHGLKLIVPAKPLGFIFGISLFYILSLIFFWNPIIVYSSFPETFTFPAIDIFHKNLPLFSILFAGSLVLFFIVSRPIKLLLTIILVASTTIFFVNSFIIPINVGTLQLGKYMKASNMAMPALFYFVESVILIIAFKLVKWLLESKTKQVKLSLIALTLILVSQSLSSSISRGDFFVKDDSYLGLPSSISFSKEKENIIFIIPDMFMGMYMKDLINESPELISEFEGFVWYPNTLSISTNTCPSISSLLAGEDFNLDILNKDVSKTMAEKITEASELLVNKAKSNDMKFTSTKMVYSKLDKKVYDSYLPTWHTDWNQWNKDLNIGGTKELDFSILWKNALFYGSPLFLKPKIYDNGNWIHIEDETNKNSSIGQECNFIRLLSYISDTLSEKGNFIYIHTKSTHGPWRIVNDKGELVLNVSAYDNQKWFLELFAEWVKWMKENGVYDNTKIVMVSDHSHDLSNEAATDFGGNYKWNNEGQKKLSAIDFWRVNALLMVKDFNSRDKLKTDWRFMSNADAHAIAFNEFDTTKINLTTPRTLPVFFVGNLPRSTFKKHLPIYKQFKVTDNVYKPENWISIE